MLNVYNLHTFLRKAGGSSLSIQSMCHFLAVLVFKKGYESVNFRLRRAQLEIRHPRTCSRSHTYMQDSNPQIHLLWPKS